MSRTVLEGCAVATIDADRTEHAAGTSSSTAPGSTRSAGARRPRDLPDATYVDGAGCLATPGLVNTHHHLYQWATRGLAVDETLFDWLTTLYPVWAGLDEDTVRAGGDRRARRGWPGPAAPPPPTTTTCSRAAAATCSPPRSRRRAPSGCGSTRPAGRWTSASSDGGLPPDHVVEDRDAILAATEDAIDRHHDPSPDSMLRIGVAPCSPFSVTGELMRGGRAGPRNGVRLHTHLAETDDEDDFCRERFGCAPVEYVEARLARPGRVVRPRRAPRRHGHRGAGRDRHRRRALPVVQRPARRRHRAGRATCATPACRSGSASTAPRPTRRPRWSRSSGTRCCSPGRAAARGR